ncbi:uncharacterized protein LOC111799040 isoform X1 [Cucurbita pepo subsp. pepo]|uniref:uncharacterized protein LOC111799040 isoform X1 n=1 Tax=Cucurbita pepo subsp. pepo TaxID=3664 RepID=UPI000C9D2B7E|nr:uncharacterized protein LOC111799040 isoform X1 [Cucurbita pepo subsp. pepo]
MHPNAHHFLPCFHCHPHAYIRMIQHLIERCLLLHMSRDECVKALARHANIRPLITLTVWKELQKENTEFFRAYLRTIPPKPFLGTTLFLIAYHLVIALYSFLIRTRY